jgi:penicillin-binding protein 1B
MATLTVQSLTLTPPEGVEYVWVNPDTGLLSDEDCPGAAALPFIAGSAPTEADDCRGNLGLGDMFRRWFE